MSGFVPREKLGKKAKKALDRERRTVWTFSPASRKIESKKIYKRKRKIRERENLFTDLFYAMRLRLERVKAAADCVLAAAENDIGPAAERHIQHQYLAAVAPDDPD